MKSMWSKFKNVSLSRRKNVLKKAKRISVSKQTQVWCFTHMYSVGNPLKLWWSSFFPGQVHVSLLYVQPTSSHQFYNRWRHCSGHRKTDAEKYFFAFLCHSSVSSEFVSLLTIFQDLFHGFYLSAHLTQNGYKGVTFCTTIWTEKHKHIDTLSLSGREMTWLNKRVSNQH